MSVFLTGTHRTTMFLLFGLPLYFLPTIIAGKREAKGFVVIQAVNILLGLTGVGLLIALASAIFDEPQVATFAAISDHGEFVA